MPQLAKIDLVSIEDLQTSEIDRIFELADEFADGLARGQRIASASGLIMATLFYEPSTRTRLSFESAMHRLGGGVISSADMQASSAAKGESLADTVRVVSSYADLIVLRHPHDGAARVAADYATCPVLNAGDGSREHPTQTLCDLYILRRKKGHLKGLTVALCGDLKFGRTVHSLIYALARFGANIVAVPTAGMDVPGYVLERLAAERNYSFSTVTMDELKSIAGGLDALYLTPSAPHQMALFTAGDEIQKIPSAEPPAALDAFYVTRMQKERMTAKDINAGDYVRFDARALKTSRTQSAVVMHPLPRTDELAYELDADPRAVYFEQAAAGVPVRMALIAWLIEKGKAAARREAPAAGVAIRFKGEASLPRCANSNCISRFEGAYLRARFTLARGVDPSALALKCGFCERELKIEFVGHVRSHRYYRYDDTLQGYVRQWIEEGSLAVFESVKQAEEGGYEPYKRGPQREIMKPDEIASAVESLADQIIADLPDLTSVSMVGVVSRGAILALRLRDLIERKTRIRPPCAALDAYTHADAMSPIDGAEDFNVEGRTIVLVDDVINSGWTVQRAMATIWKRGRPAAVRLAVLIDRGHRAVPIRPNYCGKNIPTSRTERVQVRLSAPGVHGKSKANDRVMIYSIVEPLKQPEPAN
ncbi:MAG: aspartate carbamoyltransferase catalytic subunit [Candidatus Binatus sp.]|uniref:aspartate carbamoyltransferase catalytic subunit n=1 Tax=Candidatus Binatus sp. TaxID=2811406 RepID=UPI0027180107|nr:aspartate carbamoyltransferase catalytic subunit [Candidatus Binatus sp.]MDO8431046.1 aspartate carbamoyltransferase catalytic subunit [Candidatus Binatus sp.]